MDGDDACCAQCDLKLTESEARGRWWYEPTKNKWKPVVEAYFDYHDMNFTDVKFSLDFVKLVVKHASLYDERWKKFPVNRFDPDTYKAHQAMFTVIQEEYKRLLDEEERDK